MTECIFNALAFLFLLYLDGYQESDNFIKWMYTLAPYFPISEIMKNDALFVFFILFFHIFLNMYLMLHESY